MNEFFTQAVAKSQLFKSIPEKYKVAPDKNKSPYNHLTFNVASLSEYLEIINILRVAAKKSKNNEGDLIFRGMADYRWELLPSIARQTLLIEETEYSMVKELILLRPQEFMGISSNFDLLAKMQHYGLPTRLLDFSTNPLVALFFACDKQKSDSIGRVIITNPSYPQCLDDVDVSDRYIEAVCGLCKVKSFASYFLEKLTKDTVSFTQFIHCTHYPLIAKPQYSNNRIANQAAMFMVFPNEIWDMRAMRAYNCYHDNGTLENISAREEYETILQLENLEKIYSNIQNDRTDLNNWRVNYRTLSEVCGCYESDTDIQRKSRFLSAMFSKTETLFPNRFLVVPQIKKIDDDILQNEFCSILIEPRYKKKILEELDTININERFLFPELEYTVKHVKNKYWASYRG